MQSDLCRSRQKRNGADMTAMRFVVFGSGNVGDSHLLTGAFLGASESIAE
jgi:hypothetical protein